jgi:ribonuclease HI
MFWFAYLKNESALQSGRGRVYITDMQLTIHTDGGARGNPGPAAVGVVIESTEAGIRDLEKLHEFGKTIGKTTNNVAEYTAVIEALTYVRDQLKSRGVEAIQFLLDSTLVVNQLNGLFKIKDSRLRELAMSVRILEHEVGGSISYRYVPREENHQADLMVNRALDAAA